MTILRTKAIFIGKDGSMGLEKNKEYDIEINTYNYSNDNHLWVICYSKYGSIECPYSSLETVYENWSIPQHVSPSTSVFDTTAQVYTIKTVRVHYEHLAEYCNKIGRDNIISITSCFSEQSGEHFFTIVYECADDMEELKDY